MANSTLFGLKLFWETVNPITRAQNWAGNADADLRLPNEVSLLEACKFLDEIGVTKKLNEYRKITTLLGGKITDDADGKIRNDASPAGFAEDSALFYIAVHNKALDRAAEYLKALNEGISAGMTYKEAQDSARKQYKSLIEHDFALEESKRPVSSYFEEVKKKYKLAGL